MKKIGLFSSTSIYIMTLFLSFNLSAKDGDSYYDGRVDLMHEIMEDLNDKISQEIILICEIAKENDDDANNKIIYHQGILNAYMYLYNNWNTFMDH